LYPSKPESFYISNPFSVHSTFYSVARERYCPNIKYNFTCGKELTSASEVCSVPLTTMVRKTVPDIKACGQHPTDKNESVLLSCKHSNSDD
jgi:hypothetical protein